jgi:pyruvate dehydrogenase E2 component (dihydrolipoamide acetyltransferase)
VAKEITMPKLSDTMEEGKVLRWLKREGERVERGEPIAEVETDKADMEMEAFDSGVLLAITVGQGESAAVGEVIGYVGEAGEKVTPPSGAAGTPPARAAAGDGDGARRGAPAAAAKAGGSRRENAEVAGPHADIADVIEPEIEEEAEGEEGSSTQAPAGSALPGRKPRPTRGLQDRLPFRADRESRARLKVSPLARRMAREAGLDPAEIEGSGPDGRVVRADVERALSERRAGAPARAGAAAEGRASVPVPAPAGPAAPAVPVAAGELGAEIPHSKIRRVVAQRMAESKRTVPHFYTTVAVRMERALELKEALGLRHPDAGVSLTHVIVKAAALAVERYPRVSALFEEDRVRIPAAVHIGLAVAVEDGLLVPVIRDVAAKPLPQIAREARAAAARARSGRLLQDDLQGATFSVSNLGMFPIESFAAIITPPQSAILAVGGTADEAVVQEGRVVPGKVARMTLSADHRVIDGVLAAAFLAELKRLLEAPLALVV